MSWYYSVFWLFSEHYLGAFLCCPYKLVLFTSFKSDAFFFNQESVIASGFLSEYITFLSDKISRTTSLRQKKSPEIGWIPGLFLYFWLFLLVNSSDQRLLNWGARRAALRPYFNRLSADFPWYSGLFWASAPLLPYSLTQRIGRFYEGTAWWNAEFTTSNSCSGLLYFTLA